jgi:hypothetical protein
VIFSLVDTEFVLVDNFIKIWVFVGGPLSIILDDLCMGLESKLE